MPKITLVLDIRRRNHYSDLDRRSKLNSLVTMRGVLSSVNDYLNSFGIKLKKDCLQIQHEPEDYELGEPEPAYDENDEPDFFKYQRFREEAKISNNNYDLLHKIFPKSPSRYYLDQANKEINSLFPYHKNSLGVYTDPRVKIEYVVKKFISKNPGFKDQIRIKISMDSCKISSPAKSLLNVTFTLINDKKKAKTASGNYILGMFHFCTYSSRYIYIILPFFKEFSK